LSNEVLNNYTNTDFDFERIGKAMEDTIVFGRSVYGIESMTNEYFQYNNYHTIKIKIFMSDRFLNNIRLS
jgi:hypothetical protein